MDKMKLKPIKVLTKGTLDDYDKKELVLRLQALQNDSKSNEEFIKEQIAEYESEIKELKLRLREEQLTVEKLQTRLTFFVTDESIKKEILRLYAKGNSSIQIHKVLNETKKISVEYEVINDIIINLRNKDLSLEDLEFYSKEVKFNLENSGNEEEELRISQIRQLNESQNAIDTIIASIQRDGIPSDFAETTEIFIKLMREKRANADSMAKLLKGSSGSLLGSENINTAKDIRNQLENHSKSIVENFDPSNLTKVN